MGQRWIMEGGIRVPKITRVAEIFLNTTGTQVSPNIIRQCWPAQRENMPVQNLDGMRQSIVRKLDETVTRYTSSIAWDQFAFPQTDQEYWREEALCYRPGKMLDVGTHMPGFRLMLQDDKGQYPTPTMLSFLKDLCWFMTLNGTLHNGCPYGERLPP